MNNIPSYRRNHAISHPVHNTCATEAESARAVGFYASLLENLDAFPCAFSLGSVMQSGFVGFTPLSHETKEEKEKGKRTDRITLRHPSGLIITLLAALYEQHAAYEWTLWFENPTEEESLRISALSAADILIPGRAPRLRGILGDARNENYGDGNLSLTYGMNNQPYDIPLALGQNYFLHPHNGNACNHEFPYFKMQTSLGATMAAIGWPGQWRAHFYADLTGIRFRAGQETLDTTLHPGESLRTPLITFLIADGDDPDRLTNLWRTFMMECNLPRQGGEIPSPMISACSVGTDMMCRATEENQIRQIRNLRAHGIKLDHWWMDAGWYEVHEDGAPLTHIDDYVFLGTFKMRERDFPTGMAAITDCMKETGGKTMLWFEPERIGLPPERFKTDGSTLHPDWLLKGVINDVRYRDFGTLPHPIRFVDMGNDDAREWITDKIVSTLKKGKIDMYREDHNITPMYFWRTSDEPGRAGMTENHYITGHLRMWDDIRARCDDMILDSCASGGRRNDLESMRRAVPLHIADYFSTSVTTLAQRQAVMSQIFAYFPYIKQEGPEGNGIVNESFEWYMSTCMAPFTMVHVREDLSEEDWARVRAHLARWEEIKYTFYADYYMLTDWNIDRGQWLAYSFIDSVAGTGSVIAFRREMNEEPVKVLPLKGLCDTQDYLVRDLVTGEEIRASGFSLRTSGLPITLRTPASGTALKIMKAD